MTVSETSPSTSRPPVSKPKRTKSLESEVSLTAKQKKAEKKLKRHRIDNNLDTIEVPAFESSPQKEKKSKKRKREAERSVDAHDPENIEDSGKRGGKKLKQAEENQSDPTTFDVVVPAKKRKNKTGFPDPDEDASLPEQSKKCLAYAFLQCHRPSKWKFNKARQNWILRNIWSNEMVPEAHLPLAYEYLTKVRGGVRDNLLQSCRTALETPKNEAMPSEKVGPVDGTSAEAKTSNMVPPTPLAAEITKEIRARALLDLLSRSDTGVSG